MAELPTSVQLSPLDLLMPRTHIAALLTFRTAKPSNSIIECLQAGLDSISKTIPWLSGQVFPTVATKTRGLEIRYQPAGPAPQLVNKGTVNASYDALSAEGLPPNAIPADVWPVPRMIDEELFAAGTPVFGASLFRFADGQGVGLCVCVHHNVVDATGFAEIVRLWAQHIAQSAPSSAVQDGDRSSRLSDILRSDLQVVSSLTAETLFELHPEYSKTPPTFPAEFSPCTYKIFTLSVTQINAYKEHLKEYLSGTLSTNTLVCALVWSAITRARMQRCPALVNGSSRLAMAVNGRRRLGAEFSPPDNPYLGNAIFYSLTSSAVSDLDTLPDSMTSFAKICDMIAQSQSPAKINSRHIAEVYSLVENTEDYRSIYVGWDLFSSRDLTITSWADLDLYGLSFGEELGAPEFVRVPGSAADGVAIILPRNKESSARGEIVEIMIMLQIDDMDVLQQDAIWKKFNV
ncbi:transferase family-domain-containing protein [Xylaria scruposa]|nr:transferase family-domain-containing protein [Xylaria scruposa]